MFARLFGKKKGSESQITSSVTISAPMEVVHAVHIDKEMNWSFDESVDPKTIFTKLKVIGKGGFGTVSQIVHRPSMKILAGKLVNQSIIDDNSKEEIQHEIDLMREVDSPFTVRYFGCVNFEGSLMILMEYVDRGSLRDILDSRSQVLSEDQISCVMHDLLRGLKLIHEEFHILHRDIKAANLLLNSKGQVKLADFGVSRQFGGESCSTMTIVGTPYWMAPEVISGISYSYPADIWSVGITAVELAEGAPPYVEYSPTKAMVEIAIKGFPGYRFPQMHSPEFTDFISHCVISDQNERWTPDQLLEHPFIKRAEKFQRVRVMQDLIREGAQNLGVSSESFGGSQMSLADSAMNLSASMRALQQSTDSFASAALKTGTPFDAGYDSFADYANAFNTQNQSSIGSSKIFGSSSALESKPSMMGGGFPSTFDSFKSPMSDDGQNSFMIPSISSQNGEFSGSPLSVSFNSENLTTEQQMQLDMARAQSSYDEDYSESAERKRRVVRFEPNIPTTRHTLKLEQKDDQMFVISLDKAKKKNSANKDNEKQINEISAFNKLPDRAFQQISRALSKKIPFSPLSIATNPDAPVETIYTTIDATKMRKKLLPPLVDDDGVVNIDAAIRHDNATKVCALTLVVLMFALFGANGFFFLLAIAILTNMTVVFMNKRKERHEAVVQRAKELRAERNMKKIERAQEIKNKKMKKSAAQ